MDGFHDAARVTLVETSAPLRAAQAERIANAQWAERLEQIAPGPTLLVGNEFLDCLPIRQFVRTQQGWHEKLVGVNAQDDLTFGLSAPIAAPESEDETGTVREIAPGLGERRL